MQVLKRIKEIKKSRGDLTEISTKPLQYDSDDLDQFYEEQIGNVECEIETQDESDTTLLECIQKLGRQEKLSLQTTNIFQHYENLLRNREIDEDTFDMAVTVLAAPATQVSVERSFSALGIVLDQRRTKLKSKMIDDILVCRLNSELFSLVNFDKFEKM